ncbi:MAG: hypothetical protein JO035_11580 [Betaproteobacteria bacterium]|nr:hypothetical protein [Betaproteobacteria bacterium]
MAAVVGFPNGGYRYLAGVFQYSSGVAAEPGYEIERARFRAPLALAEGFAAVEAHLRAIGRPTTAFAACELRSPAPFTERGFTEFNREYVKTLAKWGLYADERNPVARTNVCPAIDVPKEPLLHAFSYTVPRRGAFGGFVIAGSGETEEGHASYRERTVRYGESSADAMRDKVRHVVAVMGRRLEALGFSWREATAVNAYTVRDIGALMGPELAARGASPLTWHYARPPVEGLEFEMDVRGVARELVL